jgi:hypothetical protein
MDRALENRCRSRGTHLLRFAIVMSVVARVAAAPVPDQVTLASLQAAFLYNFAKFVEWPVDVLRPRQALSLCVIGDKAVADALGQTIKGHPIGDHELRVTLLTANESPSTCHLLYVSASETKRAAALLAGVAAASVFTVSDQESFAESGGIAQLFMEGDRMRFAINLMAVARARLHLSSRLLALARIVTAVE